MTLSKLLDLMHGAPMRRFGIGTELKVGAPADLAVFRPDDKYVIDPNEFLSMGRATPFAGWNVYGRNRLTVCGKNIIYSDLQEERENA